MHVVSILAISWAKGKKRFHVTDSPIEIESNILQFSLNVKVALFFIGAHDSQTAEHWPLHKYFRSLRTVIVVFRRNFA